MKCVFTLCSLLVSSIVFSSPTDSLRSEKREQGLFVIHRVEEEETIYSLSGRYGGSVRSIIKFNKIENNRIEIGQIIQILIEKEATEIIDDPVAKESSEGIHIVKQGETLYSLSRKYGVKLRELKKWNNLDSNYLSPGMRLKTGSDVLDEDMKNISQDSITNTPPSNHLDAGNLKDPFDGFEKYLVQTGETLYTIASKTGLNIDSLKLWNGLNNDYLKIGQELFFKKENTNSSISVTQPEKKKSRTQVDEKGFEKIYEEGVASVIESIETSRYLALHRTLPIGTHLEVRNLMNNQVVHVKVVGKLPDTGINQNILFRLSQPAYDQLGILDSKSRVEISYYKD